MNCIDPFRLGPKVKNLYTLGALVYSPLFEFLERDYEEFALLGGLQLVRGISAMRSPPFES